MNKIIGEMTRDELMDYIIELDEENGRYERKLKQLKKQKAEIKEYLEKHIVCMKNGDVLIDGNIDDLLRMLGETNE